MGVLLVNRVIPNLTPDVTAPNVPVGLSGAGQSETTMLWSWQQATDNPGANQSEAQTGVQGYKLYDAANVLIATIPGATSTSYLESGLATYTNYSRKIASFDGAAIPNESAKSGTATARTLDTTAPSTPTITATAASASSVSVALTTPATDAASGVATYQLDYKPAASGVWSTWSAALVAGSFPVSVTGLNSGTSYDFRARATDVSANVGAFSATSSATTQAGGASLWTYGVPTQADEQAFYDNVVQWAWTASDKTVEFTASAPGLGSRDIHNDTEADDLWNHYQAYLRTGLTVYRNWAQAWRNYFVNTYQSDLTTGYFENQQAYRDHVYGQGLVLWHHFENDPAALTAAENILNVIPSVTPGSTAMSQFESRGRARWLILACYVAEKTGNSTWIAKRNQLIDAWVQSPDFATGVIGGNYFASALQANYVSGSGGSAAHAAGRRFQSAFQLGLHTEALWRGYLATSRADVRARLEQIAWYCYHYAHDSTWLNPMVGSRFGHDTGLVRWHLQGSASTPATTSNADPSYDTALVNTLVIGYKLTGYRPMFNLARTLLRNGTIWPAGVSGQPKLVPDNQVHHYVDTLTNPDSIYFDYNKGELQYSYLLFENGGAPTVETDDSSSQIKTTAAATAIGAYAQVPSVANLNLLVDTAGGGVGNVLPYADKLPYDPITRRAFVVNSDDPGAGRRMVAYDVATNACVLLSGTVDSTVRGVAHIYGNIAIDVANRRLIYGNAGTVTSGISWRHLDTGAVTSGYESGITVGGFDDAPAMEYFPERRAAYFLRGTTLYERKEGASSWSVFSTAVSASYHQIVVYNAWHRCLILGGGNDTPNNLYRLNLDGTITSLGNSAGFGIDCVRCEFVEDPATGDFLVYFYNGGTPQFRRFNPATNTWTNPGTAGIPSNIFSQGAYTTQLLMIAGVIPELKVNVYFCGAAGTTPQLWIRRYA